MRFGRFGVTYTPSRGWFHHRLGFGLDEVRADLDPEAGLGLDHLRVFPPLAARPRNDPLPRRHHHDPAP